MKRFGTLSHYALLTAAAVTSCNGCNGKHGSAGFQAGAVAPPPASTPTPVPPTPKPKPASPATVANPAVGAPTPPITSTSVTTIDTTTGAAVDHLIFNTTAAQDVGRYLTEFVVIVHGKTASCVRLKVRPTAGLSTAVNTDSTTGGVQGSDPCSEATVDGETGPAGTETSTGTSTGTGTGTGKKVGLVDDTEAELDFMPEHGGLELAGQTAAVCSPRLFRMQANQSGAIGGLGTINTKTGRLVVVGSKVRIWLDEEYANPCTGGTPLDSLTPTHFGPLEQLHRYPVTDADLLWTEQLQNLATEMDKIYGDMTTQFGPVSDVDGNGFVEIFLSPDVNRYYFVPYLTSYIDEFRANLIYRPQDLAFYDPKTNPISNEGEILYLWAPDPGGNYNQVQYPSSNSIDSNYAKGYLASQLMTLIFANQRLIVQKQATIPDGWLVESMAELASAYYGGNDYTELSLGQYLTSRSQYISLDQPIDNTLFSAAYLPMAGDEVNGMRTMFGWYLHSRMCGGTSVAPCAKLKPLITSTKNGQAAVADLVGGEPWATTVENFGLSVAVGLLDNPQAALAVWNQKPLPAGLPMAPTVLPDLAEISQDPRVTEEEANAGTPLVTAGSADKSDRTQASPYPSKKMLLFQPLTSDSDMEFKVAQDGVAFVLVTTLIDQQTDVTAALGQGLNVVFIPASDRDPNVRRVHIKKIAEDARSDQRPDNLTTLVDPTKTYMYEPMYASADFSVTPGREIWALGSIDNFQIDVGGTETTENSPNSYEIQFSPCAGLTGTPLTTCQSQPHQAMLQVITRDYDLELAPMLIVTDTDRTMFRGASEVARVDDMVTGLPVLPPNTVRTLCEAGVTNLNTTSVTFAVPGNLITTASAPPTGSIVTFTSASGVLPVPLMPFYEYTVVNVSATTFQVDDAFGALVSFLLPNSGSIVGPYTMAIAPSPSTTLLGLCSNGGFPNALLFDNRLTIMNPNAYAHTWDNYLMMGPLGYPFTTLQSETFTGDIGCDSDVCYRAVEAARQNLPFHVEAALIPTRYDFWAGPLSPPIPPTVAPIALDFNTVSTLAFLKEQMDTCTVADQTANVGFITNCTSVAGLTIPICAAICAGAAGGVNLGNIPVFEDTVLSFIAEGKYSLVCANSDCSAYTKLLAAGKYSHPWFNTSNYYFARDTGLSLQTFYTPVDPVQKDSYCNGDPVGTGGTQLQFCAIRPDTQPTVTDIRQVFYTPASMLQTGGDCKKLVIGTDFKMCLDTESAYRELNAGKPYTFTTVNQSLPTDRVRARVMPIARRAGELISKPERLQSARFLVPGAGGIVNVIIGGRNQSQGKYLLRARLVNFELDP